jgi:hypothetical protein
VARLTRTSRLLAVALALATLGAGRAVAGTAEDALSRCLVQSSTPADNETLVFWVFAAISENPKLAPLVNLSATQRESFDKQAAALFQRLLLTDCRTQSLAALQQDGTSAIAHSFELLGATAGRQMMTDPQVLSAMQHMTRYLDQTRWRDFAAEAGSTTPAPPPGAPPPAAPPK